jgi:hypothetical protein
MWTFPVLFSLPNEPKKGVGHGIFKPIHRSTPKAMKQYRIVQNSMPFEGGAAGEEMEWLGWPSGLNSGERELSCPARSKPRLLRAKPSLSLLQQAGEQSRIPGRPGDEAGQPGQLGDAAELGPNRPLWVRFLRFHRLYWQLAAVFLALVAGALAMKKIVDGVIDRTFFPAQVGLPSPPAEKTADRTYQNALVKTRAKAPVAVLPLPIPAAAIRKQLTLVGNEPVKGYYGGIRGLVLTVGNPSPHEVERLEIEVAYFNAAGGMIRTIVLPVKTLAPNSSRRVAVPESRSGKKVSYRISLVYAVQYQSFLREV